MGMWIVYLCVCVCIYKVWCKITSVQYIQSKPLKLNPIKSINETDLTVELQGWKVKLSVTDVKEFDAWKPKYKTIRLSFSTIDAICLYFAV